MSNVPPSFMKSIYGKIMLWEERLVSLRLGHRCTRVENPGEGVPDVFRRNCLGWGFPYFGFYCVFINKRFEICLRGVLYLPSPPTPPSFVHLWVRLSLWPNSRSSGIRCHEPLSKKRIVKGKENIFILFFFLLQFQQFL